MSELFIAFRSFLRMLGAAFTNALQGIDKVDTKESTKNDYLKSTLFYLPTLRLIRRGVYLGTLAIGLFLLIQLDTSQIDLVIYWSITVFIVEIPFTVYFYYLVRKNFPVSLDVVAIIKYLVISIGVFGGVYLLMEQFLEYKLSIFEFLPNLIPFLILGVSGYLGLTYLADKKTRKLFKAIFLELTRKK